MPHERRRGHLGAAPPSLVRAAASTTPSRTLLPIGVAGAHVTRDDSERQELGHRQPMISLRAIEDLAAPADVDVREIGRPAQQVARDPEPGCAEIPEHRLDPRVVLPLQPRQAACVPRTISPRRKRAA